MLLVNGMTTAIPPRSARFQELLGGLLALLIGLHLPRAFSLLYLLTGLILWRSLQEGGPGLLLRLPSWWPGLLATPLFSLSYAAGMFRWQIWSWPGDRGDLINALLLPSLLLVAGLLAGQVVAERGWRLPLLLLLLSYSLGSLLFSLLALAINRHPWWDMGQVFGQSVQVPWGLSPVNVRSVEQNAIPALALLPAWLAALMQRDRPGPRQLAAAGVLFSLLAFHAVLSFQGRLGILVLLLAALPPLAQGLVRLSGRVSGFWRRTSLGALALGIGLLLHRLSTTRASLTGWSQGLCDERLSLHLAILGRAWSSPWGGRQLQVPYRLCDGSAGILAPHGGTVQLAHNVVLDVFLDGGMIPALLLLAALLPLGIATLRGFVRQGWRPPWEWRLGCLWGWFAMLLCQWSFQPLLYADGILYYLSFFVFAALAAGLQPQSPAVPNASR